MVSVPSTGGGGDGWEVLAGAVSSPPQMAEQEGLVGARRAGPGGRHRDAAGRGRAARPGRFPGPDAAGPMALIGLAVVLFIAALSGPARLTPVMAGEARVIQLFGRYRGTVRAPGLHWVNPFARRRRVSTRIRNLETALAKVNDVDGNPIEIAAVVVWQVRTPRRRSTRSTTSPSSSPSRPRPPSGTSRRATPTRAGATAGCRCATTPTRSPSACRTRSRPGSGRPG